MSAERAAVPEAVVAAYELFGEAWALQRVDDDGSRLLGAWERQVEALDDPGDSAGMFAYYKQELGLRAGLLLGALLASRADGSELTPVDAAQALADAEAWLDAEAGEGAWPRAQERQRRDAGWSVVRSVRRAAEAAVVGDAVAAATDLWRQLDGGDVATASLEQMLDLDRKQQAAALEGRARLGPMLTGRTAAPWVWASLDLTQQ